MKLGSGGGVIHHQHTDFRLNFQPSAAGQPPGSKCLAGPQLCHEKSRHLKTQGQGALQRKREPPRGAKDILKDVNVQVLQKQNKTTLHTFLAHENVENLAEGGNEFRISLVLPASDLH